MQNGIKWLMIVIYKYNYAYFGGGCFWCIEAVFTGIHGVSGVTSGYSGGLKKNANYKDVCSGNTKHAEICKIQYNPHIISFDILLEFTRNFPICHLFITISYLYYCYIFGIDFFSDCIVV